MRPLNLRQPGILVLSFSVYKLALLAGSTSQNRLFIPSPSSRLCKVHSSTLCSNAIHVRSCFPLGQVACVLFILLSCQCSVVSSVAHFWPSCRLIICPSSPSGDRWFVVAMILHVVKRPRLQLKRGLPCSLVFLLPCDPFCLPAVFVCRGAFFLVSQVSDNGRMHWRQI